VPIGPDPPDNLTATLLANARIGRVRLRAEARFALSGANADTRMTVIGEWAGKGDAEWRAELGYDKGLDRGRAGIGYTRRFDKVQLSGFGEVATDGSVAASLSLAFSFGPKPTGGWRMSSEKLGGRGQVMADVFMDENGDGVRQPGEAAIEGRAADRRKLLRRGIDREERDRDDRRTRALPPRDDRDRRRQPAPTLMCSPRCPASSSRRAPALRRASHCR
jgi:hypothetical protein